MEQDVPCLCKSVQYVYKRRDVFIKVVKMMLPPQCADPITA